MTRRPIPAVVAATLVLCLATPVAANNGLNLIGFGAESITMGGADLAVARDTSALNTNPAGLMRIADRQMDMHHTVAHALDVRHRDGFGNDAEVSNRNILLGSLGYARRLPDRPVTVGIGLFAQGGAGNDFRNLTTAFGTEDELSAAFRIAKLTTGLAWQATPTVALGGSVSLFYADLNQRIFPDTSVHEGGAPEEGFFGYALRDMDVLTPGFKLGAMITPSERVSLGLAYTSGVDLSMNGGTLTSDFSALGLGKVTYRDVRATGTDLPRELGVGVAFRPTPRLLTAAELNWLDWSKAVKRTTLTAAAPDDPDAPPVLAAESDMNWRDQYVIALGMAYDWSDKLILRAGYNYGRNPVPEQHMNPLLAAIARHTYTLGLGYRLAGRWRIDGGLEYVGREKVRFTNPELPFGPDAVAVHEVLAFHMMLVYR
ncbi:OmpP1/FadL family transporter [Thioalkalivibrio thiocyanodenitrificans]|uniref:OmpP1/FadL family transporter n=1 Tax=Thioalkalivibrio thiocyanodenitrificans TaxID=243063 RepID=UPI00037847A7|nr:outer membrane protein transport protein [Thioalkalivibrio thiocyanodenitrificans]